MRRVPCRRDLAAALGALCLSIGLAGAVAGDGLRPYRAVLDNGLVLLFRPNPSALTLAVCCFTKASARVETRDTAGLRNLAQQALLEVTDASHRTLERRAAAQGLRITQQVSADYLETVFLATGDQLADALGFARELFTAPAVEPTRLGIRRAQALRQVAARRELAEVVALDVATERLYRGTSCAWPPVGTAAVATLKAEQVRAFWRMRVVPNNAVVAISGPVTWEQCQGAARRAFGDLLPRPVAPEPNLSVSAPSPALVYQAWIGGSAAVALAAVCPGPGSEGFPAAAVLNAVLAGGEGSRLFTALRVDRGWTYSVSSELVPSQLCGLMAATVTCEPAQAIDVFRAMQDEVGRLQTQPPTAAEVDRAKAYLVSSYVLGCQRNAEIAHYMGLFEVLSPGDHDGDLPRMIAGVTPEQVAQAVRWLAQRTVWVQVGGNRPQ